MVTSPTGKGVILMGGEIDDPDAEEGGVSREIFELSNSMQWTRLEQTLQNENIKDCPFAIQIPDDLVYEKVQVKNGNKRRKV